MNLTNMFYSQLINQEGQIEGMFCLFFFEDEFVSTRMTNTFCSQLINQEGSIEGMVYVFVWGNDLLVLYVFLGISTTVTQWPSPRLFVVYRAYIVRTSLAAKTQQLSNFDQLFLELMGWKQRAICASHSHSVRRLKGQNVPKGTTKLAAISTFHNGSSNNNNTNE